MATMTSELTHELDLVERDLELAYALVCKARVARKRGAPDVARARMHQARLLQLDCKRRLVRLHELVDD
jgi:hypothetical protein